VGPAGPWGWGRIAGSAAREGAPGSMWQQLSANLPKLLISEKIEKGS